MIAPDHPDIPRRCQRLLEHIRAQGLEQWVEDKAPRCDRDGLIYLCRFAFFTGLITKAEIARVLELSPAERRRLIKSWYDQHREKGCGTC